MLEALLPTILAAILPAAVDGVRGLFGWFFGDKGAQPQNMQERLQLMTAETDRMRALAELDKPAGNISLWVADLRASFRYIAAGLVVGTEAALALMALVDPTVEQMARDFAVFPGGPTWGFIFGERMYVGMKNGKR